MKSNFIQEKMEIDSEGSTSASHNVIKKPSSQNMSRDEASDLFKSKKGRGGNAYS
jgi:hypothetical protein